MQKTVIIAGGSGFIASAFSKKYYQQVFDDIGTGYGNRNVDCQGQFYFNVWFQASLVIANLMKIKHESFSINHCAGVSTVGTSIIFTIDKAFEIDKNTFTVFNGCLGKKTTVYDVIQLLRKCLEKDSIHVEFNGILKPGNPQNYTGDTTLLQALSWQTSLAFEPGTSIHVKWFKSII